MSLKISKYLPLNVSTAGGLLTDHGGYGFRRKIFARLWAVPGRQSTKMKGVPALLTSCVYCFRPKNLKREGRFHLTPIYDVMSVYPVLGHCRGVIPPEKLRIAMAVTGSSRHYEWTKITGRHWIETARRSGADAAAESVLEEILASVDTAIDMVSFRIPAAFPESLAKCIFEGIRSCAHQLAMV